jgi:5-methylcytosine-specific restriction protein A
MATRTKRFCSQPGCGEWATNKGRCDDHQIEKVSRHETNRDGASKRGYNAKWHETAKAFRQRHPLCLGCRAIGRTEPATLVDHTIPHRGDYKLFWDRHNWQPCCKWHHNSVKKKLEALYDQGKIGVEELRLDSMTAVEMTKRGLGL